MPLTQTPPTTDQTPTPPPAQSHRSGLRISATQLIASALAAVTATVAASYLGVSGTVIGAAVASVVSVVGNAVYGHSLRQTGNRVRTVVPGGVRWSPPAAGTGLQPAPAAVPPAGRPRERERATSLRVLAIACAGVFVAVILLVTGIELVAGEPLSELVRGQSGHGTSVFGASTQRAQGNVTPTKPVVTPTVTVTAKVVTSTPTVTVTAPPVTATATPTTTVPAPGASATPTPTPTPTPTGSSTP
jgi:hypothetical protein